MADIGKAAEVDLRKSFESEYPAAAVRLERAYSHVRIVGKYTLAGYDGDFVRSEHFEFLREGELVRGELTALASAVAKATWPAGSVAAFGGKGEKYFEISKRPDEKQFRLDWFGARDHNFCTQVYPVYVAYSFGGTPTADVLKQVNAQLISAKPSQLDGRDVVEVTIESKRRPQWSWSGPFVGSVLSEKAHVHEHDFFLPGSWALASASVDATYPNKTIIAQTRVSYEPDSTPPKVKRVEMWFEDQPKNGKRHNQRTFEVSSVDFGPIPTNKFSLAAFGVPEPEPPTPPRR